ncbi:hypothetical protein B0T18DRAFT_401506 [Schizothecium vesticola]|uniref:Uncharacterized protein n=1 Tax=Schizothecium vesticola TaxID=314040 RepID=A0AA40F4J7_9PEZI|nr:hypothetical protein B0T18DRAFT_401506 [Schizothecium vesticola]
MCFCRFYVIMVVLMSPRSTDTTCSNKKGGGGVRQTEAGVPGQVEILLLVHLPDYVPACIPSHSPLGALSNLPPLQHVLNAQLLSPNSQHLSASRRDLLGKKQNVQGLGLYLGIILLRGGRG